ncbi:MAG: hypothetical protein ACRDDY_03975 [Clostridium sp.]|uniref:hypothetical protein n=1 Tax=Clostridium sp. TaxID=1506 RepID=UPI003EE61D83
MSTYLSGMVATEEYGGLNRRQVAMKIIDDMRRGNSYKHFCNMFCVDSQGSIQDSERKKLYHSYGFMNKVINVFVSFCPTLSHAVPTGKKKDAYGKKNAIIKKVLNEIKWKQLNKQIYDILEGGGDVFLHYYYDVKAKKFNVKILKTENMKDILLDEFNNPKTYVYREDISEEEVDYSTGEINVKFSETVTTIYEKGKVSIIRNLRDETGNVIEDDNGKKKVKIYEDKNLGAYKNMIPIIHIPSFKKEGDKFSKIPASEYIDDCLRLDQITTDIRGIHRQYAFPKLFLTDCKVIAGDGRIGGMIQMESVFPEKADPLEWKSQGKMDVVQITNSSEPIFREYETVVDNLYDTVGLTNPTLMSKIGSSDSSKMYQQVNSRMQNKIETYIDNIIEAFKPFFKMILQDAKLYEESYDDGYSFARPDNIIKNSAYDDLLYDQIALNTHITTIQELMKKKGMTEEQIEQRVTEINEEFFNGEKDARIEKMTTPKSVTRTVKNANNTKV